MSELPPNPVRRALRHEIDVIRGNWLWFVILGAALVALGVIALGAPVIASLATAVAIGSLLMISGVMEVIGSAWCREWSGMLVVLLSGILTGVLGVMLVSYPIKGAETLTILIAGFLFVSGGFKVAAALAHRIGAWLWLALSGAIDVVLAVMIWKQFPASGLVVVGVLVGITMIFRGVTWIMIGLTVKKLPKFGSA
jgi:uncharacterized membrane protein HdeD (DUF308 family)